MIDRQLTKKLDAVAARIRRARLWTALAIIWLLAAVGGGVVLTGNRIADWPVGSVPAWVTIGALLAALICVWCVRRSARDYHWVAQRVEARFAELDSSLLTAIEQQPDLPNGRYGFLKEEVIHKAIYHDYRQPWTKLVPAWQLLIAHVANVVGLLLLAAVLAGLVWFAKPPATDHSTAFRDVMVVNSEYSATIEPGNAEVERGTSLLVLAQIHGHLPPHATLVYQTSETDEHRAAMSKSLDDPVFGGRIVAVQQPLTYHVEFDNQASDSYEVTVFEYPQLVRADAKLVFPSYTNMSEKLIQDVRRVSAVEGTELTLICHINKPVAQARLTERNGAAIELIADNSDPLVWTARLALDRSRRLELHLTDGDGRQNKIPPEIAINVLPNRPPDVKLVLPTKDVQVSPIEELAVQANAWDDYGLQRIGVSYAIAGTDVKDVILGQSLAAKERVPIAHLLAFEEMKAEPDQLLSYFFWAEDIGPDGASRRTASDMYFAEVRHFEEIFRQGQQPPGGESQQQQQQGAGANAQEAERLAELQKQIINGTWKVIRRETREEPTDTFTDDVQLLLESQQSAIEQVEQLAEDIEDAQSLAHVDAVRQHMQASATELTKSHDTPSIPALQPALAAAQAAYQALLRLRAREHEVIRSNQESQQSQSQSARSNPSSRAQQQLQQLELRDEQNRYETESTARPQESAQQREDRQVLNRLRELAQRQNDLNDRIKELQSALEEAQTKQEQDEIQRQLKRLRDEQQEILRDTEELQERMERPENQERMAEDRQQLDQVRDNVRQSSEALREGMVSRAAAEGTRAERQLQDLRDEVQKRTSNQFTDEMRQMREQARDVEQKEREIGQQLAELNQPQQPSNSLRDADNREQTGNELGEQKQRVEDLVERMRQTVEDAEESEPLLAQQLYDTIRDARQQSPQQALDRAQRSLARGLAEDAANEERQAREGISQLRAGIDRAAENVLGDDTDSLRRAREELETLSNQVQDEIARAVGPDGPAGPKREPDGPAGPKREPDGPAGPERDPDGPAELSDRTNATNGNNTSENPDRDNSGNAGSRPGDAPQPPSEPANGQNGDSSSQPPNGNNPNSSQPSNQSGNGQQPGLRESDDRNPGGGGIRQFLNNDDDRPRAPIAGEDFLDWSDRLRDVEEMISDPDLRAEAARIRDRAKAIRKDVKRQSAPPNWDVVREMVSQPLAELQNRVAEELLRRSAKDALVPIDRDPVPTKYEESVRRYYERLGSGK